jgi:hypothetical protein
MLKAEMAPYFVMAMLVIPTPTVADVASELARAKDADRLSAQCRDRPFTASSLVGSTSPPFSRVVADLEERQP